MGSEETDIEGDIGLSSEARDERSGEGEAVGYSEGAVEKGKSCRKNRFVIVGGQVVSLAEEGAILNVVLDPDLGPGVVALTISFSNFL